MRFLIVAALAWPLCAQPPKPSLSPEEMASLADQVKAAIQAGDWERAHRQAGDLLTATLRQWQTVAPTPAQQLQRLEAEALAKPAQRARLLWRMAPLALEAGDLAKAESYSREILADAKAGPDERHSANTVRGRAAIRRGDLALAQAALRDSGAVSPGGALASFGPSMKLANELLAAGARNEVIAYLEQCRSLWKMPHGQEKLTRWLATVRGGGSPDWEF
jgi:hypothetical protein